MQRQAVGLSETISLHRGLKQTSKRRTANQDQPPGSGKWGDTYTVLLGLNPNLDVLRGDSSAPARLSDSYCIMCVRVALLLQIRIARVSDLKTALSCGEREREQIRVPKARRLERGLAWLGMEIRVSVRPPSTTSQRKRLQNDRLRHQKKTLPACISHSSQRFDLPRIQASPLCCFLDTIASTTLSFI